MYLCQNNDPQLCQKIIKLEIRFYAYNNSNALIDNQIVNIHNNCIIIKCNI